MATAQFFDPSILTGIPSTIGATRGDAYADPNLLAATAIPKAAPKPVAAAAPLIRPVVAPTLESLNTNLQSLVAQYGPTSPQVRANLNGQLQLAAQQFGPDSPEAQALAARITSLGGTPEAQAAVAQHGADNAAAAATSQAAFDARNNAPSAAGKFFRGAMRTATNPTYLLGEAAAKLDPENADKYRTLADPLSAGLKKVGAPATVLGAAQGDMLTRPVADTKAILGGHPADIVNGDIESAKSWANRLGGGGGDAPAPTNDLGGGGGFTPGQNTAAGTTSNDHGLPGAPGGGDGVQSFGRGGSGIGTEGAGAPPGTPPQIELDPATAALLGQSGSISSQLQGIGSEEEGVSLAEQAMTAAANQARVLSGIQTEQSQRAAMGAARSVRNRGDVALAERQALGETAFAGQEAARTTALSEAQQATDLAKLRVDEHAGFETRRQDALKAAGELGLNTAALGIDVSKANLESSTNFMNQLFGQLGLDKQLSSQEADRAMRFTQEMAALEYQYDALDQAGQQFIDSQLMQKYGIDQSTYIALKQIKQQGKMNWGQVLTSFVGGLGSAAGAAAIAVSDIRAKEHIADATDADFDALLSKTGAYTFDYRDPKHGKGRNIGTMVQDLEQTPFGESLLAGEDEEGNKLVNGAKAGLAALAGLGMLFRKVKRLEEELS